MDAQLRLPGVRLTRILDLPRAQGHLWAAAKAVFGEGTAAGTRRIQAQLLALERGQPDRVCQALTALAAQQVATLRMLLLSDRWQEVANHCRTAA